MQKLLLVQLPTSHLGAKEIVYPLGLSRLSGLAPMEYEKQTLDMNLFPDPWPKLKAVVERHEPQTILLSFRNIDPLAGHQTSYFSSLKTSVGLIRKVLPKSTLIVGGPAFSLYARQLFQKVPEIDYGVIGEAERAFPQLLRPNFLPETIQGLIWRENDQIRTNPKNSYHDFKFPARYRYTSLSSLRLLR